MAFSVATYREPPYKEVVRRQETTMSAEADVDDLLNDLRPLLVAAFQRGFRAGSEAMRQTIFQAVSMPLDSSTRPQTLLGSVGLGEMESLAEMGNQGSHEDEDEDGRPRAPRGLVKELVRQTLTDLPGLTATEVTQWVVGLDERVAPKTVGNELRRNDDIDYRREGKKWFLINDNPAAEGRGMIGRAEQQAQEKEVPYEQLSAA